MPTHPSSPGPDFFGHQPPPRADGLLAVTITHLEMRRADWTQCGQMPALALALKITHERSPTVALYRELYDKVGRPWLWYERRLVSGTAIAEMLAKPTHELHIAREGGELVGFFELDDDELAFFGLTLPYIGWRVGPWLLDRAIERAFAQGIEKLMLNTNTVDHPKALATYRKAGFRSVRTEAKTLQDPRVLWPDLYRWPPL